MLRLTSVLAAVAAVGFAFAPVQGFAAHAGAPYTNVDKKNDAGNDTGDSQVDALNAAQLDQNYKGPVKMMPPATPSGMGQPGMMSTQPRMMPPPATTR